MKSKLVAAGIAGLATIAAAFDANAGSVSPTNYFSQAIINEPFFGTVDTGQIANSTAQLTAIVNNVYYNTTTGQLNPDGHGILTQTGSANAVADRAAGQLRAAGGTTYYLGLGNVYGYGAQAYFGDTLFFTNPGAAANTITTVGFSVHLTGNLTGPQTGSGLANMTFGIFIGSTGAMGSIPGGFNQTGVNLEAGFGQFIYIYGTPQVIDQTIAGTFSFKGATASVPIAEGLAASGQYGFADFGHTATFSFDPLPNGVSYTSASGDFLTAGTTPLPAALPLFASGLGVMGLFAWRRKKKQPNRQ